MKVAIVGASGFVGSTVVERLKARGDLEIVPCIHSSGNAGQIARLGIPLTTLDLLDRSAVGGVLQGCTHVVNCSRGDDEVMLKGLRNLLEASRSARVLRFVHLGSVAVYGDPPSPDSVTETGRTDPERGSYGWVKLAQDNMVAAAAAAGLSSIVLCPPNISGPQSYFLGGILSSLKSRELALLDGGRTPCNLVDVQNLAHAVELALERGPKDGRRLFVTDDYPATWREVVEALTPLAGGELDVPAITREELVRLSAPSPAPPVSLRKSLLHLVSSDVRQALRKDPMWATVDSKLRNSVRLLGGSMEDRVRFAVEGPVQVARRSEGASLNVRLSAQQLRGVTHSCEQARSQLGYRPLYSFERSMSAYRKWYEAMRGWDSPAGALVRAL